MRRFGLIKSWQKIGGQTELAKRFGKSLYIQNFINHRGENVEWVFFKVQDFSMIMPVTENLEVVTVVQYRHGPDRISHELPAGMLESGTEEFSELALRELEEETGYKVGEVIKLASLPIHVQSSPTFCHLFLAINCKRVGQVHTDANEEIEVKLVPLKNWIEKALRGDIKESWSCLATFLAIKHLNEKMDLKLKI